MANEENLRPYSKENPPSQELVKRIGAAGGRKKAENVKAKKLFKEAIGDILDMPANDKMLSMIQKAFSIGKGTKLTLKEAMIYAQTIKAISDKDTQAFNALIDRVDGKAIAKTELTGKDGKDLSPPIINLIPAIIKDK